METKDIVEPELAEKTNSHGSQTTNPVVRVISNMKVTNPIKKLVSQQRKRYTKDGFNLDLTCILLFSNWFFFFLVCLKIT